MKKKNGASLDRFLILDNFGRRILCESIDLSVWGLWKKILWRWI